MNYAESVRYLLSLGKELAAPRQPAPRAAAAPLSAAEARAERRPEAGGTTAPVHKFDLQNIRVLCAQMGHPQRAVPCAHIAGTNGKGSTAAMLESILRAAGLRTGLYTSPHLERINERIRINGEPISDGDFAAAFTRLHGLIERLLASSELAAHPTFFECLTAMAFDIFAAKARTLREEKTLHRDHGDTEGTEKSGVDFAVYEVGLGGRLDTTNIVAPEVALITSIDFDHENYLGHSIEEIAAEKAGIIKPGVPVVTSAERPDALAVIRRRAAEVHAPLTEIDAALEVVSPAASSKPAQIRERVTGAIFELNIPLPGRFQIRNALAGIAAARILRQRGFRIGDDAIARGIAEVRWPGRLEKLCDAPAVYLDGAHNPAGARALLEFWQENFSGRRIHLVFGALRDKAVDEISGLLFPHAASVTLTEPRQSRALSVAALAAMTRHHAAQLDVIPDAAAALEHAVRRAAPDDAVFATGSLYLVGEWRAAWPAIAAFLAARAV